MIFDNTNLFSDAQAITATAYSTNIIDLGATGTPYGSPSALIRDIGKGNEVELALRVVSAFNNLTSLTVTIEVAVDAAFTSPKTVYTSPAYALADLVPGARHLLPDELPIGTDQRYVRLKYTVAGTAPTTGAVTAGVVPAIQTAGKY